jgi:hypothetical protein
MSDRAKNRTQNGASRVARKPWIQSSEFSRLVWGAFVFSCLVSIAAWTEPWWEGSGPVEAVFGHGSGSADAVLVLLVLVGLTLDVVVLVLALVTLARLRRKSILIVSLLALVVLSVPIVVDFFYSASVANGS